MDINDKPVDKFLSHMRSSITDGTYLEDRSRFNEDLHRLIRTLYPVINEYSYKKIYDYSTKISETYDDLLDNMIELSDLINDVLEINCAVAPDLTIRYPIEPDNRSYDISSANQMISNICKILATTGVSREILSGSKSDEERE